MIESLAIKNYKSIRDVRFKPASLSVLIGRNDAGKSNLLDAFQFLRDLLTVRQAAITGRGGFQSIVWSGKTDETITFDLQGELSSEVGLRKFRYFLELSGRPFQSFTISKETFEVFHNNGFRKLMDFPDESRLAAYYDLEGHSLGSSDTSNFASHLHQHVRRQDQFDFLETFRNYVSSWEVYDLTPTLMRGNVQVKRELVLAPRGENLAGVLHTIHSEYPEIFESIEERLQMLVPESKRLLSLLTQEGQTYPGLEQNDVGTRIAASSMSAGTLRFLAFLLALYSPAAPQLVCFEEPENYIHPHAVELLVDVLRNASRKRQVLIATHSPSMLNFIDPESVFVVEKVHAETKVVNVSTKKRLKVLLRKTGLGEAWYAGTIGGVPTRSG